MARILLVEDDSMVAEIYMRKFSSAGFEVDNAKTGKEVLQMVKSAQYDLVLLDMVLPEMGGLEVLKELRNNPEYDPGLKVVIFSNLSQMEVQTEVLENGADGFISKSQYTPSDLVIEVKRLISVFQEQKKNSMRQEISQENKKKILFIEDEEIFLEMFGKKLEDSGFEVTYAKNGSWGVEEAFKKEFDLIITDIMMPAMRGDEIIRELRGNEKTKHVPIIVLSASVSTEDLHKLREYGINDYYLKTKIVPSDLSRKIEELLNI